MDRTSFLSPELRLLSACVKATSTDEDDAAIRAILEGSIDWVLLAQTAIERGMVSRAAHALLRAAPDKMPDDIREAMRNILEQARSRNREVLGELGRKIEARPATAPIHAIRDAYAAAERGLAANPSDPTPWYAFGRVLFRLRWNEMAITCFSRALELGPESVGAWTDLANARSAVGQADAALADINKALELDAGNVRASEVCANILVSSGRFAEAVAASDRALELDPGSIRAERIGIRSRLFICDWRRREEDKRRISEELKAGHTLISPVHSRALFDSEAEHLARAKLRAMTDPPSAKPLWRGESYDHDKIRIAYISTDFRDHVVADAIIGCLELHDRARFEVTGISLGWNDRSATRRRLEDAFDRFVDGQGLSDVEIAAMLRTSEIDIAIDLNGYSGDQHTKIFAERPAPIQVSYLGYPGTMAVPFIDYLIADPIVIPTENQVHYTEKLIYLPYTYMPNDNAREISTSVSSRREAALPETGFVFVCHNHEYKIGPEIFDVWMRLLRKIDGSVFWFKSLNESAVSNLRREAGARGVAPERLIFARRMQENRDHLARLAYADLFLDTLPYNAHATACDALWAGVPVLTCLGNAFPGRVAASVLHAMDLPELVTKSLTEYEELALSLAQEPARLAAIKAKVRAHRLNTPLFDTARFTRDLEAAYHVIWERQRAGLPPMSFHVAPT